MATDNFEFDLSGIGGDINVNLNEEALRAAQRRIEELEQEIAGLQDELSASRIEAEQLGETIDHLKDSSSIGILEERMKKFENTARRSRAEFEAFLKAANLNELGDARIEGLGERVLSGFTTAGEAIARVKAEYASLITAGSGNTATGGFDAQQLGVILSMFEEIRTVLSEIKTNMSGVGEGLVASGGGGSAAAAGIITEITNAAAKMGEEAKESTTYLVELVKAVAGFGVLDQNRLYGVMHTFQGLAEISHGGIGTKTVENVVALTDALNRMGGTGTIRVDFSGFKDLKISKASMRNLADYLPTIAGVNVDNLIKLSNVDLTNFNNLKVGKGVAEELAKIAEAVQVLRNVPTVSATAGEGGIQLTSSGANVGAITDGVMELQKVTRQYTDDGTDAITVTKEWANANKTVVSSVKEITDAEGEQSRVYKTTRDYGKQKAIDEKQAAEERKAAVDGWAAYDKMIEGQVAAAYKENAAQKAQAERDLAEERREANRMYEADERQAQKTREASLKGVEKAREALAKYNSVANQPKNRDIYSNLERYTAAYGKLDTLYKDGKITAEGYERAVGNLDQKVKTNTESLKQNGNQHSILGGKLKTVIAQFFSFQKVVSLVTRSVREMVRASIELDTALTQMQIVTGASNAEMEKLSDNAFAAANRAGTAVADVISGATTYARLGFDPDTSTALAEYTAMLQNVGDIDAQSAQDAITAILKAFDGVDESNIKEKLDELVVVGNNFPISVSQVAEGMNNASSALAAAGNTYEKSVALLTAANTTIEFCRAA